MPNLDNKPKNLDFYFIWTSDLKILPLSKMGDNSK